MRIHLRPTIYSINIQQVITDVVAVSIPMHGEWSISWLPRVLSRELLEPFCESAREANGMLSFISILCSTCELQNFIEVSSKRMRPVVLKLLFLLCSVYRQHVHDHGFINSGVLYRDVYLLWSNWMFPLVYRSWHHHYLCKVYFLAEYILVLLSHKCNVNIPSRYYVAFALRIKNTLCVPHALKSNT